MRIIYILRSFVIYIRYVEAAWRLDMMWYGRPGELRAGRPPRASLRGARLHPELPLPGRWRPAASFLHT